MKQLSIKELIKFRNKSDRSKITFASNLKFEKEKAKNEGGGDYWITSVSAISSSYKSNNLELITDKRHDLEEKYEETDHKRTKIMYKRNIDILYNFESIDFRKWRPSKLSFLKKHKDNEVLSLNGLEIKAVPNHVFSFKRQEINEIGAIWFIGQLDGYRKDELGMFVDILFSYLNTHYSKEYQINPNYCIAVDVFSNSAVNYAQLQMGKVDSILLTTIDELKSLM